jgi:hypothetical protein
MFRPLFICAFAFFEFCGAFSGTFAEAFSGIIRTNAVVAADAPRFYRAVNLNGPALTIDGQSWEGSDAPNVKCTAGAFENQNVPLKPKTDAKRGQMIRSSRWGQDFAFELLNVPNGVYQVFAYVWEDNNGERYRITLNSKTVVRSHFSGVAGTWKRLGPWRVDSTEGSLQIASSGGAANFSGIEIWSGDGEVPAPELVQFESSPTPEQLAFFESRVRPVLIDHCYSCHSQDSDEPGGNLLLDSRPAIVKGGYTEPPILPGDPDNSLLMRAISHRDPDLRMPPDSRLSEDQIADLAEWIRMKAPDPRSENTVAAARVKAEIDWEKVRNFWSLLPVAKPQLPAVKNADWASNEIDYFILSKAEAAELPLAVETDRQTLIRRATFDLTGLPPSPEEINAFVNDPSDQAYPALIDRLLASPRYGERWGRYWLDVVRYSDTAGDNSDFPIPQMYLYRNWVIEAFNRDLPYDQFVREQLAGDLIGGATDSETRDRIIATGYIANSRRFGSRVSDYPQHLTIEDTIDNLGRTFLATSINCARCHNHKFDPIPTDDYYSLYGIFHSTRYPWPGIELEQRQRDLVTLIAPTEAERIQEERGVRQQELDETVKRLMKERDAAKDGARESLEKELKAAQQASRDFSATPLPYETFYAVADSDLIEDARVHIKGNPAKSGDVASRGFLQMLNGTKLPENDRSSGRLQLANWIVDPSNPLTARVMVNRIWLHHFGKAIVPTPNDFGRQGKPPTHPELLDWLAQTFIDSGWSVKSLHRTIMLSRVYRMNSQRSDAALEKDPSNELLTAFPRRRLDAEAIRDTMLLLGGNLDLTPGGEHPFPPQSTWKFTQHNPFKALYETNRRSVYLMTQRIQRHPYLAIFDGADPSTSTPVRLTSTTPLQALYLLNDKFVHEQAAGLARRLLDMQTDDTMRVQHAWRLMFGRTPEPEEISAALNFLTNARTELTEADAESSAWQSLIRSLIRLNEFVYID